MLKKVLKFLLRPLYKIIKKTYAKISFDNMLNIRTSFDEINVKTNDIQNKLTIQLDCNNKQLELMNKKINQIQNNLDKQLELINEMKAQSDNKMIREQSNHNDEFRKKVYLDNIIYMNGKRIYSDNDVGNFVINFSENSKNNKVCLNNTLGNGKIYINFSGNDNVFKIGKKNIIKNDILIEYWGVFPNIYPNNVSIEIGNNNRFNGEKIKFISPVENSKKIKIGNNNLLGGYITFRGRNDHLIYDINSKEKVNIDYDIVIGNNIWLCDSIVLLPKTNIKGNAIIAEGSLVNKKIEEKNVLLAGRPINIKKRNVMWNENHFLEKM